MPERTPDSNAIANVVLGTLVAGAGALSGSALVAMLGATATGLTGIAPNWFSNLLGQTPVDELQRGLRDTLDAHLENHADLDREHLADLIATHGPDIAELIDPELDQAELLVDRLFDRAGERDAPSALRTALIVIYARFINDPATLQHLAPHMQRAVLHRPHGLDDLIRSGLAADAIAAIRAQLRRDLLHIPVDTPPPGLAPSAFLNARYRSL